MFISTADILIMSILASFILAVLGIVLMMLDSARSSKEREDNEDNEERGKYGGVVVIGPIPIIFGNDSSVIKWAIALTIVVVIVFILLVILPLIGV